MTTKVTVSANHGWPVDVFAHDKTGAGEETTGVLIGRVEPHKSQDFHVHSTRDLFIHEVQPSEIEAEKAKATDASGACTIKGADTEAA